MFPIIKIPGNIFQGWKIMNYKALEPKIWKFPENIGYENVPGYLNILNNRCFMNELVIDLSGTKILHSSFIGFLIYAKQTIEKNNGRLEIVLSKKSEKIFHMLNIYTFFSRNITEKLP